MRSVLTYIVMLLLCVTVNAQNITIVNGDSRFVLDTDNIVDLMNQQVRNVSSVRADMMNQYREDNAEWYFDGATDHIYDFWFFYKFCDGYDEYPLPAPDRISQVDNRATLQWLGIENSDIDISITIRLLDFENSGAIKTEARIINNGSESNCIEFYVYADLDKELTENNDESYLLPNSTIGVRDLETGAVCEVMGVNPDTYQGADYPSLIEDLNDQVPSTFNNSLTGDLDITTVYHWTADLDGGTSQNIFHMITGNTTIENLAAGMPTMSTWGLIILIIMMTIFSVRIVQSSENLAHLR